MTESQYRRLCEALAKERDELGAKLAEAEKAREHGNSDALVSYIAEDLVTALAALDKEGT